jgi:hypothetical protein
MQAAYIVTFCIAKSNSRNANQAYIDFSMSI